MKKYITILFLFLSSIAYSQDNTQYQLGSAKIFVGNIYYVSCFVSDPNNEWTYEEKIQIINDLRIMENWFLNQALRFNVKINFTKDSYGLQNDIKLEYIQYGTGTNEGDREMVTTVLNKFNWQNSLLFYEWVMANKKCDNMFVLIFVKGNGRSYAIPYINDGMNREKFFVEGVVFYHQYLGGARTPISGIAHEILHLFGAWDFYENIYQSREREDMARKIFPDSIMTKVTYNINDLNIDEVTAWLIGWNNSPEEWYEWFRPAY